MIVTTPYRDRPLSAPALTPESQPYFDAAGHGKLIVKRCSDCGQCHHYPRVLCPFCFSDKTEWTTAAGTGKIYSFTVTRGAVPIPYALAYVTLEDCGITLMTNIVDCDLDAIHIGQLVSVVFKLSDAGTSVPMFTPAVA